MTVKFSEKTLTSGVTPHYALADGAGGWTASWMPDRTISYAQAITAMMIAETVARLSERELEDSHPHLDSWAAELALTGPEAIARTRETPDQHGMPEAPNAGTRHVTETACVKFTITTVELGRQTKIMISAHDTMFDAPPFDIASYTVPVRGRRPRSDAMRYFAEIIRSLNGQLMDAAATAPGAPPRAYANGLTAWPVPGGAGLTEPADGGDYAERELRKQCELGPVDYYSSAAQGGRDDRAEIRAERLQAGGMAITADGIDGETPLPFGDAR